MSIPTMILTADSVAQLVGDGVDVGDEVDAVALQGMTFDFICNVPAGTLVPGSDEGDVWVVQPVRGVVDENGVLCRVNDDGSTGASGVAMLAAEAVQLTRPLQWRCRPGRINIDGRWVRPPSWWFNAQPDGTSSTLRSLLPVEGAVAMPTVPDPGGPGGPVTWGDVTGKPSTFPPSAHTHTSADITDLIEAVQDAVGALLTGASGVTVDYDDAANTLTISGGGAGGLDAEAVRDTIGVALLGVGNISVTVNDAADTITISTTATQNASDAALRDRSTHTGTQSIDTITESGTGKVMTAAERTKLAGVADNATANASDASLRDRSTHTGQQSPNTITDLAEYIRDTVAAFIAQGANVTVVHDDPGDTLTITATGGEGGTTDPEIVRDTVGAALLALGPLTVQVNDAADTITLVCTATTNDTDANLRDRSTHTGQQAISTITDLDSALSGKLDKLVGPDILYGNDQDGNPNARYYSSDPNPYTLAYRDGDGRLKAASGSADNDVVTKEQLDTALSGIDGRLDALELGGGSGIPPVVQIVGDGTIGPFDIVHGWDTDLTRVTLIRKAAPKDDIGVKVERPDRDTVRLVPDAPYPVGFATAIVEWLGQSDNVAPTAGTLSYASKTHDSITYTFTAGTDNVGVTRVDAYDGDTDTLVATNVSSPWTRTGLSPLTSTSTYLKYWDAEGNTADSNTVVEATTAAPGDSTPPTAGTAALSSKTQTSITYTFTAGSDNVGVVGVDAYDAGSNTLLQADVTSPWTRAGLTQNTPYGTYFRYRDAAGLTADSNTVNATTDAAPTGPTIVGSLTEKTTNTMDTMPAHQAGDLLIMFAYRDGFTGAPALPAGWTDLLGGAGGANSNSCRVGFKVAASAAEASGTWTNCMTLTCVVVRGGAIGAAAVAYATGTTLTAPTVALQNATGTSKLLRFFGIRVENDDFTTKTPSGYTYLSGYEGTTGTYDVAAYGSTAGVSTAPDMSITVGTSGGSTAATIELTAA